MNTARLREEQEQLIRSSRELLSKDLLSELSVKSGRSVSSRKILEGPQVDEAPTRKPVDNPTIPIVKEDEDRDSILSEDSQDEFPPESYEKKFVDLNSLSAGSRRAAAPDIYNIFEQIFMEDANSNIPELPEGVKRSSIVHSNSKSLTIPSAEKACCIRIELNQDYDEIVSPTTGRGRFQFERQILADLSIAMNVSKHRFLLERIEPKKGWRKHSVLDILVIPDEQGQSPSCENLANQIAEEVNKGSLNTMPSMRRAVRAEMHDKEVQQEASNRSVQQEGELKFSLLRGGIFFDSKHLSAAGGDDSSYASHGALGVDPGLDHDGLRIALALQEKEVAAARRQKEERRAREGFWVDVEAGKAPHGTSGSEAMATKYGTFAGHTSNSQGKLLLWAAVVGGSIMLLLICWVLYLHVYRGGD